jgi:hypothetical protein
MGHHSPSFTLSRYAYLIPGNETPALDLDLELGAPTSPSPYIAQGRSRPALAPS